MITLNLTSFTHKPYYETFSPEVPDNWENQPMYNLPLDELVGAIDYALNKGYTVCWDGDVSEQGFSFKNGIAINPQVEDVKITRLPTVPVLRKCQNINEWTKCSSLNILIRKST